MVIRRRSGGSDRSSSPPARPQGEEERSGADHPGSGSGSENFRKIEKTIHFQNDLFALKIGLDRLCMSTSHRAASFAMEII